MFTRLTHATLITISLYLLMSISQTPETPSVAVESWTISSLLK